MNLELAWGRCRRAYLRTLRPGYVRAMADKRQGECPNCPHDIIDPRDLKFHRNVCGFWFRPEDDAFRWRDHLGLAREGLAEVILVSAALLLPMIVLGAGSFLLPWLWIVVGLLAVLWLQCVLFFRNPTRAIPDDPHVLVSPADGTVTHVEEVAEPDFAGGKALRISIFLSIFNVHVNRVPRTGRVLAVRYFPGEFLDARHSECSKRNEQLWIDIEDEATGHPLRVKKISGAIARRIVCWLRVGDLVRAGERTGMIKFGSRTEVLIPSDQTGDIRVRVGDKVQGGSTVLLTWAPAKQSVLKPE